ncbi:MAG: small ribosomal subunit Rsm22 family protein [Rhabdochlamydiaceae bacterium]|jgi:ribosomal protein RSM22 (predicted rRNA methylase)
MSEKIAILVSQFTPSQMRQYCLELSDRYRKGIFPCLDKREHRFAYLVTRFPATFAAITRVLQEISSMRMETMLDLGAGPGTGYLAAKEIFPQLQTASLLETDPVFMEIGKKLIEDKVTWVRQDLKEAGILEAQDLVLLSYSIGEIPEKYWDSILQAAWKATKKVLVIIEPGTPRGFSHIRHVREKMISYGGSVVAPCPHQNACPMKEPDWCHFSTRLTRNYLHKIAKEAALGFEDEKFSYIIVSKEKISPSGNRILRPPQKRKGHVVFLYALPKD